MTLIIGIVDKKHDNNVYIAGDRCDTRGEMYVTNRATKVWRQPINNKIHAIFGSAGSVRVRTIFKSAVQENLLPDGVLPSIPDFQEWLASDVIGSFSLELRETNLWENGEYHDESLTMFLCGFQGHLFMIDSVLNVVECERYHAIGRGEEVALGALTVLQDESDNVPLQIRRTFEVTSKHIMSVSAEHYLVNQPIWKGYEAEELHERHGQAEGRTAD